MPLSRYGLCDADTTAARSKPKRRSSSGAPGVGSTPPSSAWPPAADTPAASAASSISPDSRVSRTIRTCGASAADVAAAARPRARARSAVRNSPATPRTPSVPNNVRITPCSALGELRALARLLEAGLLALLDASVARQEAAALELGAQGRVGLDERAGDAVAERSRLGGYAAAVDPGHDVHAALVAGGLERAARGALQAEPREERVELAAVDGVGAVAGLEDHAGNRGLALAGGRVAGVRGQVEHLALGLRGGSAVALDLALGGGLGRAVVARAVLGDGPSVVGLRVGAELVGRLLPGLALQDQVGLQVRAGHDVGLVRRGLLTARLLLRARLGALAAVGDVTVRALVDAGGLRARLGAAARFLGAVGADDVGGLRGLVRGVDALG